MQDSATSLGLLKSKNPHLSHPFFKTKKFEPNNEHLID